MLRALKNMLPFSVKRRLTKYGVFFLRATLGASERVFGFAGGNYQGSRLSQRASKLIKFLRLSPLALTNAEKLIGEAGKLKIAVFFDHVPQPGKDSANMRMLAILAALTKFAKVYLVTIYRAPSDLTHEAELRRTIGVETVWAIDFENQFRNSQVDAAVLSYPLVADYMFAAVKQTLPATKIIYDTVDVHFVRLLREFETTGEQSFAKEAARLKKIEIRLANRADAVWCVTEQDKSFLQEYAPAAAIEIVPNIHELQPRGKEFAERADLLFIGNYAHRPNADAVFYFLDEIFPLVLKRLPNVKFYVVGNRPTPEILARAAENVIVTGFVADVAPYFESARVFVAPLRYGAGMKGKVGQALSFGLPTVTTAIGAEGINLVAGGEALIADRAEQFAESILSVYHNQELWQNLSDNGYKFIAANLSPAAAEKKLRCALLSVLPNAKFSVS